MPDMRFKLQDMDAYPLCYYAIELVHNLVCLSLLYVSGQQDVGNYPCYCVAVPFCVPQLFGQLREGLV